MDCIARAEPTSEGPGISCITLVLVDQVARTIVRRHRLPHHDLDDLRSSLWLKLLDRDEHVIKRFRGHGSLFAYLLRVAHRIVMDQQVAMLGRWRPSERARRLGAAAVAWSRMVERDGLSPSEATSVLQSASGAGAVDVDRFEALRRERSSRATRRFVTFNDETGARVLRPTPSIDEIEERECRRAVAQAMRAALHKLTSRDRRLLRLRFVEGLRISEIARREGYGAIWLYREYGRILNRMRRLLVAAGVDARTAAIAADVRSGSMSSLDPAGTLISRLA
jgi:RNA polymerase sigma factor (sigma-70 family)